MTPQAITMTALLCLVVGLGFAVAAGLNKEDDKEMSVACFSLAICWWIVALIPVARWVCQ